MLSDNLYVLYRVRGDRRRASRATPRRAGRARWAWLACVARTHSPGFGAFLQKDFVFPRCSRSLASMDLAANLEAITQRLHAACARAERDPAAVTLLAVAKGQPPQRVRAAADLGLTLFGENRVQE